MRGRALLMMLVLAAAAAQAQVYRWVDAQGRVQMGDRPPAGVEAKLITDKSRSHRPVDAEAERQRLQAQRDAWQRELHRAPEPPVETATPRPRPSPAYDADPCTRARYRYEGSRDGRLKYCSQRRGHCERVDANDLALLEREMKEACQRR